MSAQCLQYLSLFTVVCSMLFDYITHALISIAAIFSFIHSQEDPNFIVSLLFEVSSYITST